MEYEQRQGASPNSGQPSEIDCALEASVIGRFPSGMPRTCCLPVLRVQRYLGYIPRYLNSLSSVHSSHSMRGRIPFAASALGRRETKLVLFCLFHAILHQIPEYRHICTSGIPGTFRSDNTNHRAFTPHRSSTPDHWNVGAVRTGH